VQAEHQGQARWPPPHVLLAIVQADGFPQAEPDAKTAAPTRDELAVRIWEMLTEFGLVTGELPPPKREPEENHHGPQDAHRDHRQAAGL
jgi:hypothetical protein